ncbi:MAG: isoprenylcysteine carboxylmethyltransferase family protein [Deltaproteobacteria bacterium]|nr:isoprenylcysteine carboxylmethyltransferase family protein [Deltaproteobacteria bacterium]
MRTPFPFRTIEDLDAINHYESPIELIGRWISWYREVIFILFYFFAVLNMNHLFFASPFMNMEMDGAGLALMVLGTLLRLWSVSYHGAVMNLITIGPYRYVRHPIYVANFFIGLGLCLMLGQWYTLFLFIGLYIFVYTLIIISEEKRFLRSNYTELYTMYQRQVFCFLPLRKFQGPLLGQMDLYKIKKGREWVKSASYFLIALAIEIAEHVFKYGYH